MLMTILDLSASVGHHHGCKSIYEVLLLTLGPDCSHSSDEEHNAQWIRTFPKLLKGARCWLFAL